MTAPSTPGHRAAHGVHDRPRLPVLAVLAVAVAGLVAAGATVDRRSAEPAPSPSDVLEAGALAPLAPAPDQLGSTWYCAGGTAREGGFADHRVIVVNPGDAAVAATFTAFAGATAGDPVPAVAPVEQRLEVPARGRVAVRVGDLIESQFGAALVEVASGDAGSGEVVVEHVVRGDDDLDAAPCATQPSATWHLAAGATTIDARERLALFNPFPDDAVVDVVFTTPDGLRSPPEFAGFVVPAQRVVGIDVNAVVSRHPQVAVSVVARSGRLVVDRLQAFEGGSGPDGLAITTAAPLPAPLWYFPDGYRTDGLTEVVSVYNPGDAAAEVDVELIIDPSEDPAVVTAVEPFELSIPPRRYAQVALHEDERVPPGLGHAIVVRSQNGVPVVAERWIRSADPAPRTGLAATLGSPVTATRWLTAAGGTGEGEAEFLVLVNPSSDAIARISVLTPTPSQNLPIAGLQDLEIQPGRRRHIDLGEFVNRETLPLVVVSTQPIVVERGWYPLVGGIAQTIAVAAAAHAVVPSVDSRGGAAVVIGEG